MQMDGVCVCVCALQQWSPAAVAASSVGKSIQLAAQLLLLG